MKLNTRATKMVTSREASVRSRRLTTVADCQRVFANAKPAERKQIKEFVQGLTEPKRLLPTRPPVKGVWAKGDKGKWATVEPWEGVPYWLTYIRHLDSGRIILTAGCALPSLGEQGLNANQMRKVVGLPPVKGGDYKLAPPAVVKQPVKVAAKRKTLKPVRRK